MSQQQESYRLLGSFRGTTRLLQRWNSDEGSKAQDIAEGLGVVKSEEKAEQRPHCSLQLIEKRLE